MKQQVIEITIEAHQPIDAKKVSEQEVQLISIFLNELLIEMLEHLEDKE